MGITRFRTSQEVTIPHSHEDVWRVLADVTAYSDWWPTSQKVKILRHSGELLGTELEVQPTLGRMFRFRFEELEDLSMRLRFFGGALEGPGGFHLYPEDESTRVLYEMDVFTRGLDMAALSMVVSFEKVHGARMLSVLQNLDARLKALAEAKKADTSKGSARPVKKPVEAGGMDKARARKQAEAEQSRTMEEARHRAEAEEAARLAAQEDARRRAEEDAARLAAEEEARRRAKEEAAARAAAEEVRGLAAEEARHRVEAEEAARFVAQEAAKRQVEAEEATRLAAEEEAKRQAEAEATARAALEEAQRQAAEEARRWAEARQAARLAAAEEAAKKRAEEEAVAREAAEKAARLVEEEALRRAEEEKAVRAAAQEETRRRAEEEAALRDAAEAARRRANEEEAARLAAQEQERRQALEAAALLAAQEAERALEEARRRDEAEEAARLAAEEAARRQAKEEAAARLAAEEAQRRAEEEEAARRTAKEEARRRAEEEAAAHLAAQDARRRAEEADIARRNAEEEARKRAEEARIARRAAEEEARKRAEAEAARLAAEEALRRAEAAADEEEAKKWAKDEEAARAASDEARHRAETVVAARLATEQQAKSEAREDQEAPAQPVAARAATSDVPANIVPPLRPTDASTRSWLRPLREKIFKWLTETPTLHPSPQEMAKAELSNFDIARLYLEALSSTATPEEMAQFFAPGATEEEFPHRFRKTTATRALPQIVEARARALARFGSQRYELTGATGGGSQVAMEVRWNASVAATGDGFTQGQAIEARLAIFLKFADGKIVRQKTYACFEPWSTDAERLRVLDERAAQARLSTNAIAPSPATPAMDPPQPNFEIARAYLTALGTRADADAIGRFFATDAIQDDFPTPPTGAHRDLQAIKLARSQGLETMTSERYELLGATGGGSLVALEVAWSAVAGSPTAGQKREARLAILLKFRNGLIVAQRTYKAPF